MPEKSQKSIFLHAVELETPEARSAFLESACGSDDALRASVDQLLSAHNAPTNALDHPIACADIRLTNLDSPDEPHSSMPQVEHIGMTIGDYKLLEQIGEGGFGLVFVAQQERPVSRRVALKIIKPGTGSKEVLARFEAERQAVAMMDHPNIAKVFDAGVTEDERPYFVMELVRGVPITDFCDNHRLTMRDRLSLFSDVGAAIQHAHQKGVIHRDLKPSNIMVTLHDDKPVVKVIDFGVAKAIGQSLTDKTIYTRFFSMIGTPLYMSPEQAEMSGLDVDTRSDIYSLGVLLYELLTGTTPFARERLNSVSYDEMRRIICEEAPPLPSKRLTTMGGQITTVCESRGTEPRRITTSIRGDMDWIVMKALEKDRSRRYESAAAMAADVRRYLSQEPIEARPPSRVYRLQKFASRNRVTIVAASIVTVALVAGTAASLYQMSVAIDERNEKEVALRDAVRAQKEAVRAQDEIAQFSEDLKRANALLGIARSHEDSQQFYAASNTYQNAIDLVPNYYLVWIERARLYSKLSLWESAANDYSAALELHAPLDAGQWQGVPALFHLTGRDEDYAKICSPILDSIVSDLDFLDWNQIRLCLAKPLNAQQANALARRTSDLLNAHEAGRPRQERNGQGRPPRSPGAPPIGAPPPGRRPPEGFGPLSPSLDREFSPDRNERPGPRQQGGPPRGPDPWQDSFFGPPGGPRRKRGPAGNPNHGAPEEHTPRAIQFFVAGWAHVRAGQHQQAINLLNEALADRGWPNSNVTYPLLAIAHFELGDLTRGRDSLRKSSENLKSRFSAFESDVGGNRPWFDVVEAVALHQEAARRIQGSDTDITNLIQAFQESAKARFSASQP